MDRAETTTTGLRSSLWPTRSVTPQIRSAEPTDVPPNFITIMACISSPRPKGAPCSPERGCFAPVLWRAPGWK